jgi:hypothetical protein
MVVGGEAAELLLPLPAAPPARPVRLAVPAVVKI